MKNHITSAFLILFLILFILFIKLNSRYSTVVKVISPTKFEISNNSNKNVGGEKLICAEGIEIFSLEPTDDFIKKYSKSFNLSINEIISLGYLAQDYSEKLLKYRKITTKYSNHNSSDCKYAYIKLNGMDYNTLMANSGYGIIDGKIKNPEKFKHNLENARKLNLVILNHHSSKYHTLDCPYGNAAHDKVIIPLKQLPSKVKPCRFCHDIKIFNKNNKNISSNNAIFKIIQPKLTVTDGSIKMFFTDYTKNLKPNKKCNTEVCSQLINLINESKDSIDIAIYGYDNIPAITEALTKAKNRGVKIRYVYDSTYNSLNDYYKDNNIIINLSIANNTDKSSSKISSNMIMHNKFIIFDKQKVYTGSMNISQTGLSNYDVNNVIIINSKEVSKFYEDEFNQMIAGKFHKAKSPSNTNNKFKFNDGELEIYFSPKDKVETRIIELINNSKNYIYIPTYLITNKNITSTLIQAKSKGVDIRIIIDGNSVYSSNSQHKKLRDSSILLKTENYAGKLHAKSIIIDDEYIITGSMNLSNSGVNKNDENTLIIRNKKLAKAYKEFFLYLWTIIPNKYLKQNAHPESKDSIGSCSDGVDNNFNGKIDSEEKSCILQHI